VIAALDATENDIEGIKITGSAFAFYC
jgi:hypothetical protein